MILITNYVRLGMLTLAAAWTLFVFYASLVPLQYAPCSFEDAARQFSSIPYLVLGLEKRGDWVANGIIQIPSSFLAMGGLLWRRKSAWASMLAIPAVCVPLIANVFAIEFAQIWFPPRVVSQNDLMAGTLGVLGGAILWLCFGERVGQKLEAFAQAGPGATRWLILVEVAYVGLLLYCLVPLDIVLSLDELGQKAERLNWLPFADLGLNKRSILAVALALVRVMPLSGMVALRFGPSSGCRYGLMWAIALELVKIPIFSRHFTTTSIVLSAVGAIFAAVYAHRFLELLKRCDHAWCWFLASCAWSGFLLVGFLARFDEVLRDATQIRERLLAILEVPFARAHLSSELEAAENLSVKILLMAALAFLLRGYLSRLTRPSRILAFLCAGWFCCLSFFVEIAQAFLPPLVPDITDLMVYAIGGVIGIVAFPFLMQPSVPRSMNRL